MRKPTFHIFVCTSSRPTGQKGFCHSKGASGIMEVFMDEIEERGLGGQVMVTNTGCLGVCEQGPIVIVYPDNVWYGSVTDEDVEEIIKTHIEEGKPLARLLISK